MPYLLDMATATTTQEIEMTTTKTTTLNKVGNAYATLDLRFYVKRDAAGYRLHDRETRAWWHLGRNKVEALIIAEERIQRLGYAPAVTDPADSLPWDTTLDLAEAGLWSHDADGCCCSVCGRNVPSQKHGVVLVGGGAVACKPEDADLFEKYDAVAYLCVYPVGSECIKKIPAEYRYTFANKGKVTA